MQYKNFVRDRQVVERKQLLKRESYSFFVHVVFYELILYSKVMS